MPDIYEQVTTALNTLNPAVPHALHTYKADSAGTLPDVFITFSEIDGDPIQSADNAETERNHIILVRIFSRDGLTGLPDVETAMNAAGFIFAGRGDIPYTEETSHFGRAERYTKLINQ